MFRKLHQGYQRSGKGTHAPYLAKPVEVHGKKFTFKPVDIDTSAPDYHQPWDGFEPACTLEKKQDCKFFPAQTANIKVQDVYHGIEKEGDEWMHLACAEALVSLKHGGGPFGAVILQIDDASKRIIRYWANHNQVTAINDPTAHAEVMTIRSACASLGVFNLGCIEKKNQPLLPQPGARSHCVIFSSAEPCPMCYAAICWANLKMLCFGATRFDAAVQGVNFSDEEIYEELSKPYSKRTLKVYQLTVGNSLDAFNQWKRSEKTPY